MNQALTSTVCTWPDGTRRSQGNAFSILSRPRAQQGEVQSGAAHKPVSRTGKALPFSLPGTRARTR